ncbi:hypothetical protein SeLEV6574_g06282 [Synchytrium endobioticum]|uniref:Uncharacterized protein n=1 Tax=Synchytrium endobioticum TaxID=286115 RepID=A0A507CPH8_9FUNG|nr:hypothetical protein SeLEV6574_g06282 [Synchytrium endobioticum]
MPSRPRNVSFGSERTRVYHPEQTAARVLVRKATKADGTRTLIVVPSNTRTDDIEYVLTFVHPDIDTKWYDTTPAAPSGRKERKGSVAMASELQVGADGVIRGAVYVRGGEPPTVKWTADNWSSSRAVSKLIPPASLLLSSASLAISSPRSKSPASPRSLLALPLKRLGFSPSNSFVIGTNSASIGTTIVDAASRNDDPTSDTIRIHKSDGPPVPLAATAGHIISNEMNSAAASVAQTYRDWSFEIDLVTDVLPELERLVGDSPHEPKLPGGWSPLRVGDYDDDRRMGCRPRSGIAMSFVGDGVHGSIESVRWSGTISAECAATAADSGARSFRSLGGAVGDTVGLVVTMTQIIHPSCGRADVPSSVSATHTATTSINGDHH